MTSPRVGDFVTEHQEQPLSRADEAKHLDDPSVRDTNVAVAKVLLQFFPGGGVIAEMMNRIPSKRAERQQRFAPDSRSSSRTPQVR